MNTSCEKYFEEKALLQAKKSWDGVDVDSYMKNVRDMKTETIRCRDLQILDWIADNNGYHWQIIGVGDDYADAAFEGNEGDPWEFCDKEGLEPAPIQLTPEILEKNGWWYDTGYMWLHDEVDFGIERWNGRLQCFNINQIKLDSVHQLQHSLRLCGLNDLADNFKL